MAFVSVRGSEKTKWQYVGEVLSDGILSPLVGKLIMERAAAAAEKVALMRQKIDLLFFLLLVGPGGFFRWQWVFFECFFQGGGARSSYVVVAWIMVVLS